MNHGCAELAQAFHTKAQEAMERAKQSRSKGDMTAALQALDESTVWEHAADMATAKATEEPL